MTRASCFALFLITVTRSSRICEYEITVDWAGALGAQLNGQLEITSFHRNTSGLSVLESLGVVKGDNLIAVGNVSVHGLSPKTVKEQLRSQSRPMTLRFAGAGLRISRKLSSETQDPEHIKSEGHIDLLDGPLSLFSVPATRARFGGLGPCYRVPLTLVRPADACAAMEREISGSYVVVLRGGCSFASKAVNVQEQGGLGIIVVNDGQDRFRMSGEDMFGTPEAAEEIIPSVMLNAKDGQQVINTIQRSSKTVFARLVISEECFGEEGEWHRVHDVAWKDHPDLAHIAMEERMLLKRARQDATQYRVTVAGLRPVNATTETANAGLKRRKVQEMISLDSWEGCQGLEGRKAAERRVRRQRAEQARTVQDLRSATIVLRSRNVSYMAGRPRVHNDFDSVVGREPPGPILARAEFLASGFGGAIPLGMLKGIQFVEMSENCSHIVPWPKREALVLVNHGTIGCPMLRLLSLMEDAQVGLLALVDETNRQGRLRALQANDFDRDTALFIQKYVSVPVVELCADEGQHLIEHAVKAEAMLRTEILENPHVIEYWRALDLLHDPSNWPPDSGLRQRLFSHVQQRCDPYQMDGSLGRYRYLIDAYEKIEAIQLKE